MSKVALVVMLRDTVNASPSDIASVSAVGYLPWSFKPVCVQVC